MSLAIDPAGPLPPSTVRDSRPRFAPPPPAVPSLRTPRTSSQPEATSREIAWDCTATLESAQVAAPAQVARSSRPAPQVEVVTVLSWSGWIQRRVAEMVAEIGW